MPRKSTQGSRSRSSKGRSRGRSSESEAPKKRTTRSRNACTLAVCKRVVEAARAKEGKRAARGRGGDRAFQMVGPSIPQWGPEERAEREAARYRSSFGPESYPSRRGGGAGGGAFSMAGPMLPDFDRDWRGDSAGHSRAARLGWDNHYGIYGGKSRSARRGAPLRFDPEADRARTDRDWFGEPDGHRRAAHLGWDRHYGIYGGKSVSARRGAPLHFDPEADRDFDFDGGRDRIRRTKKTVSTRTTKRRGGKVTHSATKRKTTRTTKRLPSGPANLQHMLSRLTPAQKNQLKNLLGDGRSSGGGGGGRTLTPKQLAAGFGGGAKRSSSRSAPKRTTTKKKTTKRATTRSSGGRQLTAKQIAAGFGVKRAQAGGGRKKTGRDESWENFRASRGF